MNADHLRLTAPLTPSQTIGPYFHDGLAWNAAGRAVNMKDDEWLVGGAVRDANGDGVPDAMLEVWLPPASFQRVYTDAAGRFAFVVRRGDAIAHITIFARGLQCALRTRLYATATADDLRARPELAHVPADRLATLVPSSADPGRRTLEWSIRLQGDGETVFFDLM
jgi:protocatechuate 3,4-dioxygenase, alpha subunit